MVVLLNPPLTARNGRTLKVLLPGRVSDPRPGKQNEEQSLGDQQDIQRRWLAQHTDLPVDITVVAGSGSGEQLDREEYLHLLELIESKEYDLVLRATAVAGASVPVVPAYAADTADGGDHESKSPGWAASRGGSGRAFL